MTDMRLARASATTAAMRDAEAKIMSSRGTVSPLYQLLLHSPAIASGWESLLTAVRRQSSLSPLLRELVILRVAVLNNASYEFEAHAPIARDAGLSEEKLQSLREGNTAPFSAVECLALEYCDVMTREVHVPDALFERIRAHFNDTHIVELTTTIAAYNMVSRFLEALHVR